MEASNEVTRLRIPNLDLPIGMAGRDEIAIGGVRQDVDDRRGFFFEMVVAAAGEGVANGDDPVESTSGDLRAVWREHGGPYGPRVLMEGDELDAALRVPYTSRGILGGSDNSTVISGVAKAPNDTFVPDALGNSRTGGGVPNVPGSIGGSEKLRAVGRKHDGHDDCAVLEGWSTERAGLAIPKAYGTVDGARGQDLAVTRIGHGPDVCCVAGELLFAFVRLDVPHVRFVVCTSAGKDGGIRRERYTPNGVVVPLEFGNQGSESEIPDSRTTVFTPCGDVSPVLGDRDRGDSATFGSFIMEDGVGECACPIRAIETA